MSERGSPVPLPLLRRRGPLAARGCPRQLGMPLVPARLHPEDARPRPTGPTPGGAAMTAATTSAARASRAPTPRAARPRSCASWSPTSAPSSSSPRPRPSSSGPWPPSATRFCVTSSMGDAVLAHLASKVAPGIDVVFLDTGYHFVETIGTRDAVEATLPVNLITITPVQSVAEQDAAYGKDLYKTDPDLCCALRKVAAAGRLARGYDAWATGLRRAETHNRVIAPVIGWDAKKGKVKVSPLARWSDEQVERYIAENGVLVNPLVYDGYPSHRLLAVHPTGRPGRGPAQRALGRHQQDRVRDPLMTQPQTTHRDNGVDPAHHPRREARLMAAPALVALAHGSRDPRSAETIKALVNEVRAMRPDLRIEPAFLELSKPAFHTVGGPAGEGRPRRDRRRAAAAHRGLPRQGRRARRPIAEATARHEGLQIRATRCSASRRRSSRCSTCGCARRSRTPGSASSTPWCWPRPAPATRSPTRPSPGWPASGAPATSCRSRRRSPRALRRPPVRPSAPSGPRAAATSRSPRSSWRRASCPTGPPSSPSRPAPSPSPSRWAPTPSWPATILARYAVGAVELVPVCTRIWVRAPGRVSSGRRARSVPALDDSRPDEGVSACSPSQDSAHPHQRRGGRCRSRADHDRWRDRCRLGHRQGHQGRLGHDQGREERSLVLRTSRPERSKLVGPTAPAVCMDRPAQLEPTAHRRHRSTARRGQRTRSAAVGHRDQGRRHLNVTVTAAVGLRDYAPLPSPGRRRRQRRVPVATPLGNRATGSSTSDTDGRLPRHRRRARPSSGMLCV